MKKATDLHQFPQSEGGRPGKAITQFGGGEVGGLGDTFGSGTLLCDDGTNVRAYRMGGSSEVHTDTIRVRLGPHKPIRAHMDIYFGSRATTVVRVEPIAENINYAMAAVIRGLRGKKSWSQEQLADKSGVNITTLKRILKGSRDINVTQLALLADAFGTTSELMMRDAIEEAISMSEGSTTNVTKLSRPNTAEEFDNYEKGDRAAHPKTDESTAPDD